MACCCSELPERDSRDFDFYESSLVKEFEYFNLASALQEKTSRMNSPSE